MSISEMYWKAILYGCLVTVGAGFVFSILALPVELGVIDLMTDAPLPLDEFAEMERRIGMMSSFAGILVSFGLGGYIASKIAKSNKHLHAFLVVSLVLVAFWLTPTELAFIEIARNSVIAVLAALIGCRIAIRARLGNESS